MSFSYRKTKISKRRSKRSRTSDEPVRKAPVRRAQAKVQEERKHRSDRLKEGKTLKKEFDEMADTLSRFSMMIRKRSRQLTTYKKKRRSSRK